METSFHPPLTLIPLLANYPHSHHSPPSLGVPPLHHPFLVIPIFGAPGVGYSCAALVLCAFAFYIWIQSYRCFSCLFLSRHLVFAFMLSYSTKHSAIIRFFFFFFFLFFHESWGGGLYLFYSSSSSSYMTCIVFCGDEC